MAKSVITIPATVNRHTAAPIGSYKKRRVAAYARVSTDHEEQQSSYEAQVDYYTNYINGREDWEFVSVYADEGITGCNTKKRDGFNKNGGGTRFPEPSTLSSPRVSPASQETRWTASRPSES